MNKINLPDRVSCSEDLSVPTAAQVAHALKIISRHEEQQTGKNVHILVDQMNGMPSAALSRTYAENFVPDPIYMSTLPDLQNGPESLIKGAKRYIQHVGISNFVIPLKWRTAEGQAVVLETSVSGSVSLEAAKKGINMSRIMRSFYKHEDVVFDLAQVDLVIESYLADLESFDARLQLKFRYPVLKKSLRSGLKGYQYYDVCVEVVRKGSKNSHIVHFDYVYSSTCPCSLELSEHARNTRGKLATPHSQRSVARVSTVVAQSRDLCVEDLVLLFNRAIPTETQVMVKREDEQAFAELNGANPIFVEDAVRLICESLEADDRLGDFRVVASHQESLHSHDAISILAQGKTFDQLSYDPHLFASLHHVR